MHSDRSWKKCAAWWAIWWQKVAQERFIVAHLGMP